jgi:hypothetical protein
MNISKYIGLPFLGFSILISLPCQAYFKPLTPLDDIKVWAQKEVKTATDIMLSAPGKEKKMREDGMKKLEADIENYHAGVVLALKNAKQTQADVVKFFASGTAGDYNVFQLSDVKIMVQTQCSAGCTAYTCRLDLVYNRCITNCGGVDAKNLKYCVGNHTASTK